MKIKAIVAALAVAPLMAHAACTTVKVEVAPFEVSYDHSLTYAALNAYIGAEEKDPDHSGTFAATFATYFGEIHPGCVVKVGYKPVKVRVAHELTADKCAFDHVMTHEEKHVSYYREALATIAKRIEARAGEPNLARVVMQELEAPKPRHKALDSQEEYRTNWTACNHAIFTLTGEKP